MTDAPAPSAWLDPAAVLRHVEVKPDAPQAPVVELARAAAGAYVERVRPDLFVPVVELDGTTSSTYVPDAAVVQGAVLLAARWYSRRQSPAGLATFAEFGAAAVVRLDVDVERLLGVGRSGRPRVG